MTDRIADDLVRGRQYLDDALVAEAGMQFRERILWALEHSTRALERLRVYLDDRTHEYPDRFNVSFMAEMTAGRRLLFCASCGTIANHPVEALDVCPTYENATA